MNSENSSRFCDSPSELIVRSHETESLEMPAEVVMDTGVVEISQVEHKHSSSNLSCSVQLENLSSASLVKMSQKLVQINDDAQLEIASPRLINESKHASPPTNFSTDTDSESLQLNAKVNDTIQSFKVSHENHPESSSNYETKNSENSEVHQSDNLLLHKQIETLTCKLLATQEQVDRLLEEKRLWVGNMPNANTAKEPNHQVTSGELRGRWMQAKNLAETYKREKEAMVIKYAQSEQKRFQLEQQIHSLECKISRLVNTNNLEQLKQQTNESEQNHITDKSSPKKQAYKTTANSSSTEKTNSNEKSSMEHIQKELATARERIDALLKKQSTDESRITSLTSKLSQVQESLKSEQKKSSSLNDNLNRVNKSLENALKQAKEAERLREREAERLCSEVALQEAQATIKQVQGENDSLKQQLKDLENVKCDYEKSQSRIQELTNELSSSSDMKLELQSCKHRIDELSDFTRRLTERNTNLQAEHLVTLNSLEEVKHQLAEKDEEIIQLNEKYESERNQLQVKINTLQREFDDLYVKLNQLNDSENLLRIQLKEEKQRATAMHKRDAARIKDIAREVTRCLSSHHYNNNSKMNPTDFCQSMLSSNSIDVVNHDTNSDPKSCRNSLNSSLKSLDLSQIPTEPENDKTGSPSFTVEHRTTDRLDSLSSPNNTPSQNDNSLEQITGEITNKLECSERDALLLKIDRLQRIQVKLTDKLEFFQEHCYQLTEELNKKSKIIQNLLVTSDKRCGDNYNNNNNPNRKMKASNHKHTSIISSFKTTRTTDSEICRQEIDEKLQTVLENTMFKNITLKENLHTLGSEISSLRLNHERVLNSLCQQCKLANQSMHKTPTKLNQVHLSNNNNSYSAKIKSEPPIFQNGGMSA